MSKLNPDDRVAPEVITSPTNVPEVQEKLAVFYPLFETKNVLTEYLSKYRLWKWEIREIENCSSENYGKLDLSYLGPVQDIQPKLVTFHRDSRFTIGEFLTGNVALVIGFVVLKNRIVNMKNGGMGSDRNLNQFFQKKTTSALKDYLTKK